MQNQITIFTVEHNSIVAEAYKAFIARQPNLRFLGNASDGRDAVRQCKELQPHVVAHCGAAWLDRLVAERVFREVTKYGTEDAGSERFGLTSRQLEVLKRLVEGQTNAQIAKDLGISSETVKANVTLGTPEARPKGAAFHRSLRVQYICLQPALSRPLGFTLGGCATRHESMTLVARPTSFNQITLD